MKEREKIDVNLSKQNQGHLDAIFNQKKQETSGILTKESLLCPLTCFVRTNKSKVFISKHQQDKKVTLPTQILVR